MENSDIFDIDVTGFILLETSVIAKNSTYVAISVDESADLKIRIAVMTYADSLKLGSTHCYFRIF